VRSDGLLDTRPQLGREVRSDVRVIAKRKSLNDSIDLKAKRVSSNPAPRTRQLCSSKAQLRIVIVFA
jgi:hypothetical protein